ncbi:DUF6114 domain-containing protein [Micromonospora sp. bgisy143]|uniref:DUF6114 domain-containing protein n=1 Tax=Micromonospora sp. bgisy143 TaxID=3413790 RepID=UPI003EB893D5
MTTANPSHVRPSSVAQAWRRFRGWRRSRPFWGGLLTVLAGVEMFASTRMTLNGLSFHSGATGLLSLLIPVILVTCGLLLWFSPGQRLFYSIVAAVTAVYALIGLNLGGFFVGLLLGIVGSALAFAWTPNRPAPTTTEPATTEPATTEPAATEPPAVEPAEVESPATEPAAAESSATELSATESAAVEQPGGEHHEGDTDPERLGRTVDPRTFGVVLAVLGLASAGLAAQPRPVQAAPVRSAAAVCPTPSRPAPSTSGTSTPTPSASPQHGGNIITDILDGIGDLLTGGHRRDAAAPTTSPTPSAKPTATPTIRPGQPTACPSPGRPDRPGATKPGTTTPGTAKPGTVEPGKPLPRIAADPNLPRVAQTPSKLTGSSVRMTGLRFDGITELQTEKGTLKVLKFSMREAVTDDFLLRADGPQGRNQRYATDRLTVSGNVAFYATRFVGKLLGIKVTLTPDLPLPDGLPVTSPIPITFTDPVIDLAYVTSNTLTARPALALTLG